MDFFGKFANRELIGIDISGEHLRLAHIRVSPNRKEVLGLLKFDIGGKPPDEVAKVIKASFDELKPKNFQVISVIPPHQVITKNIEIPSVKLREIEDIIDLQAGRHTPFSREEIIVDYLVIGTYKHSYTKILLVIVARNVIKRQFEILSKAGVRLEKVALLSEGLAWFVARVLKLETENSPAIILHIDEDSSNFTVSFRNKPIFVRNIPIGAQHIAKEDAQDPKPKFVEEIKRSLESYQGEDIEKSPNMLILTGAIDGLNQLEDVLNDNLHIPSRPVSYYQNLALSKKALEAASASKRHSFLNVIAPAFACEELKVDLVPEEIKLRKALEERAMELIKTGVFLLSLFILIFSVLMSKIYFKSACLDDLKAKYQSTHQEAQVLEDSFTKVGMIRNYLTHRGYSLEVLSELYGIAPWELKLSDIRFDSQDKMTIKGTAESMSVVFSFVENLEQSKYFKDVKTRYTTKRKEESKDVTDFEIIALIEK